MDKSTLLVLSSLLLNICLVAGIFYHNYLLQQRAKYPDGGIDSHASVGNNKFDLVGGGPRIALLQPLSDDGMDRIVDGFVTTIREHAQAEPYLKIFDANGSRTLMRAQFDEMIDDNYDLIVTIGSQASQMAREMTNKRNRRIPVLFMGTGDPEKLELVDSISKPGGHVTGVSSIVGTEWIERMVDLIPVLYKKCARVLLPYDPTGLGGMLEESAKKMIEELEKKNIEVRPIKIYETNDVMKKVQPFLDEVDMTIILPDATVIGGIDAIVKLSNQYKVPIYAAMNLRCARSGAAMSLGYYEFDMGARGAEMALKILEQNENPSDLPVDSMVEDYKLMINLNAANKQGLLNSIDEQMLFLMDNTEIIERSL